LTGPRRGTLLRVALIALCSAALIWTIARLGPRRVLQAAAQADPLWLALALAAVLARFLIWGFKWMLILRRRGRVSYHLCLGLVLAGSFVNLTTPTAKLGGGIVRAMLLARRRRWPPIEVYGWSLTDQLTNLLGQWLLFSVVAIAAAPRLADAGARIALLVSGIFVLGVVVGVGLVRTRLLLLSRRAEVGQFIGRLIPARFRNDRQDAVSSEWVSQLAGPVLHGHFLTVYSRDLVLGGLGFACLCVSNVMVFRALGADVSLVLGSAAVLLGYLAGTLVGIWGGIGVTEVALTGLFVQLGLPLEVAATGALLHRAGFYLIVLLAGGPTLLTLGRTRAKQGENRQESLAIEKSESASELAWLPRTTAHHIERGSGGAAAQRSVTERGAD
jgi:uncharacterized protein (TIRG00374 family)